MTSNRKAIRNKKAASKQQPAFYTRLRLVRTERSLSRQQLADAVGVHYQTIGYIERGDYTPSIELVLRLARHFNLPVEALFSLDPFAPLDAQALTGFRANRDDDGQLR